MKEPVLHLPLKNQAAPENVVAKDVKYVQDERYGACAEFDGISSCFELPGLECGKEFTFAVWVRRHPDIVAGRATIMEFGDDAPYFGLEHGQPYFRGRMPDKPTWSTWMIGDLISDEWVHLAVVSPTDGSTRCRLYVNGVCTRVGGPVLADGVGFGLGYHDRNSYFRGRMAEAYVFDAALSSSEIRELMAESAAPPSEPQAPVEPGIELSDNAPVVHNVVIRDFLSVPTMTAIGKNFYKTYLDDYDFLFVVPSAEIVNALNMRSANFRPVRREICPQLGVGGRVDNGDAYGSPARLKGVIWLPMSGEGYGPPTMNHEILHYWGVRLKSKWESFITGFGSHWGYASTNGSLGGFDISSLRDKDDNPISDPTQVGLGTTIRVHDFAPNRSSIQRPYSPLELYYMGLIPKEEAPQDIYIMINPEWKGRESATWTDTTDETPLEHTAIYEVDGFVRVSLDELIEFNGGEPPRASQTKFRGAFICLSTAPASAQHIKTTEDYANLCGRIVEDPVLTLEERVAAFAAKNGPPGPGMVYSRKFFPPPKKNLSFEEATGDRMSIDVRLG